MRSRIGKTSVCPPVLRIIRDPVLYCTARTNQKKLRKSVLSLEVWSLKMHDESQELMEYSGKTSETPSKEYQIHKFTSFSTVCFRFFRSSPGP